MTSPYPVPAQAALLGSEGAGRAGRPVLGAGARLGPSPPGRRRPAGGWPGKRQVGRRTRLVLAGMPKLAGMAS